MNFMLPLLFLLPSFPRLSLSSRASSARNKERELESEYVTSSHKRRKSFFKYYNTKEILTEFLKVNQSHYRPGVVQRVPGS